MQIIDFIGFIFIFALIAICIYIYLQKDDFDLKCIISNVNGKTFCVRDRQNIEQAVDLLAETATKMEILVNYLKDKYPDQDNVQRLAKNFDVNKIKEILPNSTHTAYTENKKNISFCLNVKKNRVDGKLIDPHTLLFVAIHEMAHICTQSIGHKTEFWENFKFLLTEAKIAGIHEPKNYKEEPQQYCSTVITDNPYFEKYI